MSPHSSPEQTAGRMSLQLSITTNQIIACSNQGSINVFSWSRLQTADAKVLFDVACDRILERFLKFKTPKYLQRKTLA